MGKSIFYSWQSDIKENRNFIMKCINKAIEELNGQEIYQMYDIERDTCGDSGSPDIKERVFSKIDKSDYFIADVTIINPNVEGKKTPNPNVLIELGYAAKRLGWSRIICIFNTKYGDLVEIPFDIRTHRVTCYSSENDKKTIENYITKAIVNTVNIVNTNMNYEERSYNKVFKSDNMIEIIEEKLNHILESNEVQKKSNYITNNYSIEFIEYDDEEDDNNYAHFSFVVKITDDTYSYNEYKNQDCSVFFEFNEFLKQINFHDNKVYSAFDISPGFSPSGKNRAYSDLMDVIMISL